MGAILLAAALLRLERLDQPLADEFSWREASTAMMAEAFVTAPAADLLPRVRWAGPDSRVQGRELPLFAKAVGLAWRVTGVRESVGRGLGAFLGVASVLLLHRLVRRLGGDEERALAAAAVLAVLPGAVLVDRSFLPEPAMLALALAAALLGLRLLDRPTAAAGVTFAAALGLALLAKLPAAVMLAPIGWAAVAVPAPGERRRARALVVAAASTAVALATAYYVAIVRLAFAQSYAHVAGWHHRPGTEALRRWLAEGLFLDEATHTVLRWLWTPGFLLLGLAGLVLALRHRSRVDRWFLAWAAGFAAFYILGASELRQNVWNYHIAQPALAALAGGALAAGLRRFHDARLRAGVAALVLGGLALAGRAAAQPLWSGTGQAETIALGRALERDTAPEELVVTIGAQPGSPLALYYARRIGWVLPVLADRYGSWMELPASGAEARRLLVEARRRGATVVGLTRAGRESSWLLDEGSDFRRWLRGMAHPLRLEPGYEIWRFRASPIAEASGRLSKIRPAPGSARSRGGRRSPGRR